MLMLDSSLLLSHPVNSGHVFFQLLTEKELAVSRHDLHRAPCLLLPGLSSVFILNRYSNHPSSRVQILYHTEAMYTMGYKVIIEYHSLQTEFFRSLPHHDCFHLHHPGRRQNGNAQYHIHLLGKALKVH